MIKLINEVIDIHGRATRLYADIQPASHGLIDITITSTFSGSSRPDLHRKVWQTSLPADSIDKLRAALGVAENW